MFYCITIATFIAVSTAVDAFVTTTKVDQITSLSAVSESIIKKNALIDILENARGNDKVLACPRTKEPLRITSTGPILGGISSSLDVCLKSSETTYRGRTNMYYNLLEQDIEGTLSTENPDASLPNNVFSSSFISNIRGLIPPPLASILSERGILPGNDYIAMRDLFTSPSVSFAYERGWRQGFAAAGFPGADKEYEMARDYFMPLNPEIVVDMSCATGLFTRRLVKSNDYSRVIGCDYSDSMLREARKRINSDTELNDGNTNTRLDLVRCDVGNIPMISESVDAFHAGAAMHCWPDLDAALSEIHRVLKPGGRYFATTFLTDYFSGVNMVGNTVAQQKMFQEFTRDSLDDLLLTAGFEAEKFEIEILGSACVVIRAEK